MKLKSLLCTVFDLKIVGPHNKNGEFFNLCCIAQKKENVTTFICAIPVSNYYKLRYV